MPSPSPQLRVLSRRTVKPPPRPRPRQRIPLTTWDVSFLSADYIQKGLLYAKPPFPTARLLDHLQAALAQALHAYYPVAGRFATDQHRDADGNVLGCSVSIDCDGQGVDILHAVADGVAVADVVPPDADVPLLVQSLFPLDGAVNHDGHHLPLFVVQVTDLTDGVFLGFAYNHALSDGTALWRFINVWAGIARDSLSFSGHTLEALKDRAREELLAAGDAAGAAAVTKFQALSSLVWRCVTRARRLPPDQTTFCRAAINNRTRLRPQLPPEYFDPNGIMMGSSPRFDMYGCDFGWGAPLAARSGKANKSDGKASLYPGQEGGGSIAAELVLTPEHMALLEQDDEFWAAVTPDKPCPPAGKN
uniref:Acetyltransferase n=1 Tax=Saccharum hybrid cultivar R570 TaxID=131158 RepID=A0A059Q3D8_9POAL|nr:hypothetical protein SHCRBa_140_J14_R_240 [Saccharum hybrid cultivar R570]